MQRGGDETMKCLGQDHPGQNRKGRPKRKEGKKREKESGRPGLDHPGRKKQQEPPPHGL